MSSACSAMRVRNTPLPASWLKNALRFGPPPPPPPPCGCGDAIFRPLPMSSGKQKTTSSSNWFRLRRKTSRSSEEKNLRYPRTGRAASTSDARFGWGGASTTSVTSALNVESLPGQAHEDVFEAGGLHDQLADADARVHELGGDPLRLRLAELGGDDAVPRYRVGELHLGEDLGRRVHVGGSHADPGGMGAAQVRQRSLEDQLPGAHHPDVRAHLLDLGEQVRGDEHGYAVRRDLPDEGPD